MWTYFSLVVILFLALAPLSAPVPLLAECSAAVNASEGRPPDSTHTSSLWSCLLCFQSQSSFSVQRILFSNSTSKHQGKLTAQLVKVKGKVDPNETPTIWLENGRQSQDSNLPSLLSSLTSKISHMLVVLLITTNFSVISFLWETRLAWVSCGSCPVASNLCFLYWHTYCSFIVNPLGARQYPHWHVSFSGTRASSVLLIFASPGPSPAHGR